MVKLDPGAEVVVSPKKCSSLILNYDRVADFEFQTLPGRGIENREFQQMVTIDEGHSVGISFLVVIYQPEGLLLTGDGHIIPMEDGQMLLVYISNGVSESIKHNDLTLD